MRLYERSFAEVMRVLRLSVNALPWKGKDAFWWS